MATLEEPLAIGGCEVPNRLYRAPLLECAGNGPDAVDRLIEELLPAAESGVGLVFQGATIVRDEGGCAAPGMTRVHDPAFVARLSRLTEAIHDAGGRLFLQLEHGGLRSMETWHAGFRREHPDLQQLAVSKPPWQLRALDRAGFLEYDPHVLSTPEVYDLAADFGRAAGDAAEAGYDGIHLAGANMGIVQQFLSPFYNRRTDEFGGSPEARLRFLEVVHDEIRERAGDLPLVTKVPAETPATPAVRRKLSLNDGVEIARRLELVGYDAVVPVKTSVVWDMSIVRGEYPERAWESEALREGYDAAFGGPLRRRLVAAGNRLESLLYDFESAWNEDFCRRVRDRVSIPVLAEGGIRGRGEMDRLLGADGEPACDAVGMARPFYAEPRLGARLLAESGGDGGADGGGGVEPDTRAICESCNNCTVPQATGAPGICRTPDVLRERRELEEAGAYGGNPSLRR